MSTPSPSSKRSYVHLVTLWLSWAAVTTLCYWWGWHVSDQLLAQLSREGRISYPMLFACLEGITPGVLVGLGQTLVLKWYFRNTAWWPWILVTIAGFVAGHALGLWSSLQLYSSAQEGPGMWVVMGLGYFALLGLVIGVAQAPILSVKLKGVRGFWWPGITALGNATLPVVWLAIENVLFTIAKMAAVGVLYGLVSGLGLALLSRTKSAS